MADAHLRPVLYSHRFKSGETSGSSLRKRQRRRPKAAYINPYRLFVGSFIANWLERRKELSPDAKLCYARLSRYADRRTGMAWLKQETLGEDLGVSPRTIRDYLGELEKHSLIESEQRGFGRANRYRFLQHPWFTSDQDRQDSAGPLKFEENHLRESNPHTGPEATDGFQSFESFWAEYPKKVKRKLALDA
jgi:Helix-turn-helix domain